MRQTTSASASSKRRTTQPPSKPLAPVTNTGRSCQNCRLSESSTTILSTGDCCATKFPAALLRALCPCIARKPRDETQQAVCRLQVSRGHRFQGCCRRHQDNRKLLVQTP